MLNELYILMRKHRLTDLAYKNVHFTKEGKIAIIDTGVAGCNCFNFTKQLSPELQEYWRSLIKNGSASALWPYKRT